MTDKTSFPSRDRPIEVAKTPAEPDPPQDIFERVQFAAANDNDRAWPLVPFPEGWYGA
jgi:hypothetical protein